MNILIISLPRTGSTELGKKLAIDNKLVYNFEPFNPLNKINTQNNIHNTVVKTIIFHKPNSIKESDRISWLIELISKFEKTILLSRRDLEACAESYAYLNYKSNISNFSSVSPYLWEKTPNYNEELYNIKIWNDELNYISEKTNIPITYYEDIYDLNDKNRLRKGNKKDYNSNLI
jgi:hypothetical protein